MRRRFVLFVVAMVATLAVWAQVPQTLTYQAVVRDGNGRLVCNSNVGVRISILQGSESGVAVYSDQQTVRTNANGLFTLLIGTAENSIGGIDWAAGPYYLKSEIDHTGGSNYTLATVQQMFSVPYALRAHTVDSIVGGINYNETDPVFSAWNKDYNDLINRPTIPTMVSELTNDAGYLTFFTESQILSISNDTIFLTGGSFVKLPAGFSGDYNDLVNLPTIPTVPTNVSDFVNDAGYITSSNIPTNVSELTNDAGYLASYTEVQTLGNVVALGNAANGQLKEVSDPTEALDAVNLQTLNAVVVSWTHLFDSLTSRFDSITHRYDSIMHNVDSIIHYQDSVIDTLSNFLSELGATTGDTTAVKCEIYNWYGTEYTVSGDYQHRLTNVAGFDSVLTLHLTINYGTHDAESQTSCDNYTWHGNDYTASGTYTYDYTNGVGCASTDTLYLTINVSNAATDTHTECDNYTWIDGNSYTVSNSTAMHTLTNVAGCDSVVTLNLTLNSSTHNAETQVASGSYTWHETTYTEGGDYTYSYTNVEGCESVDTLHLTISAFDENGATFANFTVANGHTVRFSKGNLQFKKNGTHSISGGGTATGTWRFAEQQYDYIGAANSSISTTTSWIDLFGWGTSGWNSGANAYQPWSASTTNSDYYTGGSYTNSLTGSYSKADWGTYNAISNGGNQVELWRTLTMSEWSYLLFNRAGTYSYAEATVNEVAGLIVFPDDFTLPAGISVNNVNAFNATFGSNVYNLSQWVELENAGCVFLPTAGRRGGVYVYDVGTYGYYWTSTCYDESNSWGLNFYNGAVGMNILNRASGRSVRLVMDESTTKYGDTVAVGCDSFIWYGNSYTASGNYTHTFTTGTGFDSILTMHLTINYGTYNAETQVASDSYTWHGTTYTEGGDYTYSYTNVAGCESVDTLHLSIVSAGGFNSNGASNALFSVTDNKKVRFSKGNLQFSTTGTHTVYGGSSKSGTWRFALHQYDYIGSSNEYVSCSYSGWIDLFPWGTSGWNSGANEYAPCATSSSPSDYYPGGSYVNNLTEDYARADWGMFNAISNGGNIAGIWRTLTIDEWRYLLNTRTTSIVNGTSNGRYAKATIAGKKGLILFPDSYTHPSSVTPPVNVNISNANFASNTYNDGQWSQMEDAGCIFLPAAGDRLGLTVNEAGEYGDYWSSTHSDGNFSLGLTFGPNMVHANYYGYRYYGEAVRLVQDAD